MDATKAVAFDKMPQNKAWLLEPLAGASGYLLERDDTNAKRTVKVPVLLCGTALTVRT